jgi:FkbM family methyltransferase
MRMTGVQKMKTALGVFSAGPDIRRLLIRRYWDQYKTFELHFAGVHAVFSTADFYSNYWFYGPQNETQVYEPATTRLLLSRLRGCRGFADLGANLGYFAVIAAVVLKQAPVFAFEMDASLAPLIKRNLQLNGCENGQVLSAAVGDTDGATVSYTPHPFSFVALVSRISTSPFDIRLAATTVSLDKYFADNSVLPNLLKIDVDGAEMAVLRGMSRLLAQPDLQMLLEVHAHHLPQFGSSAGAVLEFLYEREFKTYLLEQFRNDPNGSLREIRDAREITAKTGDMLLVTRGPL